MIDADHKEGYEMNKDFDENKVAEKAAKEKARIAEEDRLRAEDEVAKLAEIRANLAGEDVLAEGLQEKVDPTTIENVEEIKRQEKEQFIALNNGIVNMENDEARSRAVENLSEEEISLVARYISINERNDSVLSVLENTFQNKPEIVSSPEMTNRFKEMLSSGHIHLYKVDRIQSLPGISKEIFNDDAVRDGIKKSMKSFLIELAGYGSVPAREWPHVSDAVVRVVRGANISNEDLRDIAEEIKEYSDLYKVFVTHFGVKNIYPELNV